uniref:Glycosyltransferase-related n=1 Tax=Schistosoma mansoni TaxID=6183 RepID=A0A3Q0KQS8_SCHMA
MATTYITVIHFLVTTITSNRRLMNLMNTWKLRNMEYYFYNCNNYLTNLQWINSRHPAGTKPFLKLMLTEILPTNISKVIVLDTDILLNTDIIELWNHFENFSQTQSIGIGLEQNPHFQDVMPKLESDWEGYGYNNGVLLFDLSKIRLTLWNELWIVMTRNVLNNHGYLITGEQDILNLVLFEFKHLLYEIPCEWNIQLSEGSDPHRCPVSWLTYMELRKQNQTCQIQFEKLDEIKE